MEPYHPRQVLPPTYALGMEMATSPRHAIRRLCCVGQSRDRAVDLFHTVVRNRVSPCTLREILEDLA